MNGTGFLNLAVGSRIVAGGRAYRVTHHLGLDSVLGEDLETGAAERLHVAQIKIEEPKAPEAGNVAAKGRDLESISDEDWQQAQRRFEVIKPLLENRFRTRADAKQDSLDRATYRRIRIDGYELWGGSWLGILV